MIFNDVPKELMVYGTLFSLTNRIQTIGDGFFSDITTKQHFILMTLGLFDDKNPSLKEVSDIIGCSYQNIKKIATALEKAGYLKIERDANDKRKYNLVKTDKMQTVSSDIDNEIKEFINILFQGVSDEQLACVLKTLSQMDKNLKEISKVD